MKKSEENKANADGDNESSLDSSESSDTLSPLPEDLIDYPHEIDDESSINDALPHQYRSGSHPNAKISPNPPSTARTANTAANSKRRTTEAYSGRPIFPVRNATPEDLRQARQLIQTLQTKFGFTLPDRGNLDDPCIMWKEGKPDYTIADLHYFLGKTQNHPPGSLEMTVENFIKTWEMEATHKEFYQWTTVDKDNYEVQANGGKIFSSEEAPWVGNYNWLLSTCKKELYDSSKESFESSHGKFRYAFPEGFPFEVLEVLSGPPKIFFTWRHWAVFSGVYAGNKGTGETVTMTGFGMAHVNDEMKIQRLEIYFNSDDFMEVMMGKKECVDGKVRGIAFGEPIAGGVDELANLMDGILMSDKHDIEKSKSSSRESKAGIPKKTGGKCPFSGATF